MRIRLGDPAVGRPAGMSQADGARGQRGGGAADLADTFFDQGAAVAPDRDAPGVVAAILQSPEPFENQARGIFAVTNVAKYSAHLSLPQVANARSSADACSAAAEHRRAMNVAFGEVDDWRTCNRSTHAERDLSA